MMYILDIVMLCLSGLQLAVGLASLVATIVEVVMGIAEREKPNSR